MKKRILVTLLASTLIITSGCGNTKTVEFDNSEQESITDSSSSDTNEEQNIDSENSSNDISKNDEEVCVVLTMFSTNESETIEDYVNELNEENNTDSYAVYDETHYSITMSESERKAVLEEYASGSLIDDSFNEIFSDEQYNSAFIKMDYDDLFQNITFYADRDNYDDAGISVVFGPVLIGSLYSDIIQAYSLIPVDERTCIIKILDNETNEVLYDSSENE